jgi:hypothetical protein
MSVVHPGGAITDKVAGQLLERFEEIIEDLVSRSLFPKGSSLSGHWEDMDRIQLGPDAWQCQWGAIANVPVDGGTMRIEVPVTVTVRGDGVNQQIVEALPDIRRFRAAEFAAN